MAVKKPVSEMHLDQMKDYYFLITDWESAGCPQNNNLKKLQVYEAVYDLTEYHLVQIITPIVEQAIHEYNLERFMAELNE
jgi:hypothetical protein